jgi:hypothetical protein
MNKIQILLDNGFITLQDVFDYVNSGEPENDADQMDWSDDDYQQMAAENEAAEQLALAHFPNLDDYHPEYVLASTSDLMQETMVFPSNEDGDITDFGDLECAALRYGNDDWEDAMSVVCRLNTDEYKYIHVKTLNGGNNIHNLFKRINTLETTVI